MRTLLVLMLAACEVDTPALGEKFNCAGVLVCDGQRNALTATVCAASDPEQVFVDGWLKWLAENTRCVSVAIENPVCLSTSKRCATTE